MPNILILMPTSGQIDTPTVKSLLGLTQIMQRRGISFAYRTIEFSDIVMSRNHLMSGFMADKHFTHALLLDSDMSFSSELFFDLLNFDEDFTCAAYPQRRMPWNKLRAAIEREASKPVSERATTGNLLAESMTYNIAKQFEAGVTWPVERRDGFRKVPGAGTGFMLIKRIVPEKMAALGVADKLKGHDGGFFAKEGFHDFFSHLRRRDNTAMHGEDSSFCRRWIEGCDGEIWCHETAQITHHGRLGFQGDYAQVSKPKG